MGERTGRRRRRHSRLPGNLRIEPAFLHTEAAQGSDDGKRVNHTVVKPAGAADKGLTLPPCQAPSHSRSASSVTTNQKPLLDTTESAVSASL